MKKTILMGLWMTAIFGILFNSPAIADDKTYINGFDANYPPFSFVDQNGNPDGFDIMALNWIAQDMGFTVSHQPVQWDKIIATLKAKQIDIIASGMSIDYPRKQQVNFTNSYYKTVMVLIARKNTSVMPDKTMESDVKWGVQNGTSESRWIEDVLIGEKEKPFKLIPYDSMQVAINDILGGHIDLAAVSQTSADDFIAKGFPLKSMGSYGQPDDETAYAVRKEDKELLKTLNEGLKHLMASAYWQELKTKYEVR